tara:strand:- start:148 stop:1335 length:1188 start_codon:yes stop_codon:yes gene_type:complete
MGKLDPDRLDSLGGIFDPPEKKPVATRPSNPMESRMAEINAFREEHGREPSADATGSEQQLAWSLQAFRENPDKVRQLTPIDHHGLLTAPVPRPMTLADALASDDPLFSDAYGLSDAPTEIDQDLLDRMEERRKGARRITGEITERRRCEVFGVWKAAFARLREDINTGRRRLIGTAGARQVEKGDSFIVDGQISTIADILDVHDEVGLPRKRLRVVIDNGTEYEPYVESFSKALWRDPNSRRIAEPDGKMQGDGLFASTPDTRRTGCIYAARTLGDEPRGYAKDILKIGRTKGNPARRVAGASNDPTFLRQPAHLVRQWDLVGYEPKDVEGALHAFFSEAAVLQEMTDGFGKKTTIREWFLLTPEIVDEAIQLILQRKIGQHRYDAQEKKIVAK